MLGYSAPPKMIDTSYEEAINRLYRLEFTGMKLGLDNIRALMESLGNPHSAFLAIHVAGTNGKGSVSNMLAAALQANGYKTGLFTSPHLVSYTERMKINGKEIARERLVHYFEHLWREIEKLKATFFEATTAIAFEYFRDEAVDVAVIETGLGGRLDATNVLERPLATVITSIGLEHTEILGDTLEKIAYEKACIFKPNVPAIVNAPEETHHVFIAKAREVGAPVYFVEQTAGEIPVNFSLAGDFQKENFATVQECLRHLPLPLDHQKSLEGIANTPKLTGLRARLEEFPYEPANKKGVKLMLDVAHNPHGLKRVKEYFLSQSIRPIVTAGFAKDKDIPRSLEVIKDFAAEFIAISADMHRAIPASELHEIASGLSMNASCASSILKGVGMAIQIASPGDVILLTGSHYVVGEFLAKTINAPHF